MTQSPFERVILYARHHRANEGVTEALIRLSDFLKNTISIEALAFEETCSHFPMHLPEISESELGKKQDLIIVVGGDGSMLSAGRIAMEANVPIIGVNRGRLGFLTDISPYKMEEEITAVLNGRYLEEKRFLLKVKTAENAKEPFESTALNDVVLTRGKETQLVEFDVIIDDLFVGHYRADGMISATPTGSTAYALSAGGPIMHPTLNAIVLVPMFSHSLSSRPLVIDGDASIEIKVSENNEHELRLSADGHASILIAPGESVFIEKAKGRLRLLHPEGYHYYAALSQKLGWEFRNQG